ncbi:MAG: hypothetical protein RL499_1518 [Actinomycetota bacterium]|jgi:hypothetical protein
MNSPAELWSRRFAPVTDQIGFLRAPLMDVAASLRRWREKLHGSALATTLEGSLEANIRALEPLTFGVVPRELLVATENSEWTAIFDCMLPHGDPISSVSYLARIIGTDGIVITSIPPSAPGSTTGPYGARQFEVVGPASYRSPQSRAISVTQDGNRWRFDESGSLQEFETPEAYLRRRVEDRLTGEMLVQYSSKLGLRPFDGNFFEGPCVLVTNSSRPPSGLPALTISEASNWVPES